MRSGTIAFLCGILALQQFKALPEFYWLALICLILPLGFYYQHTGLKIVNGLILGFIWAWLNAGWILGQHLPEQMEGKDVAITGHIASIPIQKGRLWQFEFDVLQARFNDRPVSLPKHIRLSWYGRSPDLIAGDQWQFTVRLKRPHGFMNPGGFDYEQWLFTKRIRATGYVRSKEGYTLLASRKLDYPLQRLRQRLQSQLAAYLSEHPMQGVVSALTIGYRDAISQQQWAIFRQTGTNHLVAISGLHIGLVAGLVFMLVKWGWARLGRLPLRLAAPKAAALFAFLAAGVYAAMAGWSLPTQRALIMVAVVMLAVVYQRHVLPSYGLALALLLVLLHDPLAVLSPGFWLSFGAVALIFMGMQGKRNGIHWWDKWFRVQWIVGLGLLPLLLLFFQQSSLISPLANIIAVPVVSLLVVPVLLAGLLISGLSMSLGRSLIEFGATVLEYLTDLLAWMGQLTYATWNGVVPDTLILLLSVTGLLILMFAPIRTGRWLGMVCLLPLIFHQPDRPRQGEAFFTLLDVGQGLSAVIQTQNHSLVFDTGPRFSSKFDTGSAVLIPFLYSQQIETLDMLIVSHGDNDHIGGANSLLTRMPVKQVYTSARTLLDSNRGVSCRQGQEWQWDGVLFTMLHPREIDSGAKENNQSCVLYVRSRHGSVLLPGDIEKEAEHDLLEQYEGKLRADILVAPHHGSKTSSTEGFIRAVQPRYVLYPVGYRNRYHFPYRKVVARYQQADVLQHDTARNGAIGFRLEAGEDGLQPDFTRQSQQRYWHHKHIY